MKRKTYKACKTINNKYKNYIYVNTMKFYSAIKN